MRGHEYRQFESVVGVLRQVPRSVWVTTAVLGLLVLVGLVWAAVLVFQWFLGQDPALAGQLGVWLGQAGQDVPAALEQAGAAVPGLVEPVQQAVPGMAAQLDQWIPGAGARFEEAAAAFGASDASAAGESATSEEAGADTQ